MLYLYESAVFSKFTGLPVSASCREVHLDKQSEVVNVDDITECRYKLLGVRVGDDVDYLRWMSLLHCIFLNGDESVYKEIMSEFEVVSDQRINKYLTKNAEKVLDYIVLTHLPRKTGILFYQRVFNNVNPL